MFELSFLFFFLKEGKHMDINVILLAILSLLVGGIIGYQSGAKAASNAFKGLLLKLNEALENQKKAEE